MKRFGPFGRRLRVVFAPPTRRRLALVAALFAIGLALHATDTNREVGQYLGASALILLVVSLIGIAIDAVDNRRWWTILASLWLVPYGAFIVSTPEGVMGVVFRVWLGIASVLIITHGILKVLRNRTQKAHSRGSADLS